VSIAPIAETSRPRPQTKQIARVDVVKQRGAPLALACLTVVATVLRFWRIGHQSFWYDESVTLVLVHHSFGRMLSLLPHTEGTPPVYYCVLWLWARIFGFSEAGLRSLSAVAGIASIPAMYGIGARLISRRAGIVAAALAAFNPFLIWYSQEARAYSLLVLTSALALLAFVHLVSPRPEGAQPSGRWLITWVVAASLALATHYFALLGVGPQAIWLLWAHRRKLRVWLAVDAVTVVGVALLPLALSQKSNAAWITTAPLSLRLGQIAPQFILGTGAPARGWLKLAAALALLLAAAMLPLRADLRERRGALLVGSLAVAGFVLSLLLIPVGADELITRNLIVVLVALIVVVAAGLGARRAGLPGLVGTAILCSIGLAATIAVASDVNLQRPPWRAVANVVESNRPAGAASAVLVENTDSLLPLGDYIPGLYGMHLGASVQELDVVAAVRVPAVAFCWWGAACHLPFAPLDSSIHIPGFHRDGPVTRVDQFSIYRLRAVRPVLVTRLEIGRALNGFPLSSYGVLVQPPA
jgi:uncharacterized membrane protein